MVAVTGATGFVGTVLVQELVARGEEVRYLTRSGVPPGLARSGAVPVSAGLFDQQTLVDAFDGARVVYHSAARISILSGDREELHRVNVEGTKSVLSAAKSSGVGRFVHVGSIEAFPLEVGARPITEAAGIDPNKTVMEYGRSKALGMLATLDSADDGFECVVCCPTAIFGPPDYRHSPMGEVILDTLLGRLPAYVSGGFDFVDVRDVANGIILAAERGRSGKAYLLSGSYATIPELMDLIQTTSGVPKPSLRLPIGLIMPFMPIVEAFYRFTGKPPRFTRSSLQLLSLGVTVSSSLARDELGYTSRPLEETVADTVEWFVQNGYVDPSRIRRAGTE